MRINIRPTTSVYATYKNIKYTPWNALAEFVDNSTQSYYDNIHKLKNTKYWDGLVIKINYDKENDTLTIKDNAFGMNFADFQRAIILDSKPNLKSRSEFGMGLKTAACWFGYFWEVETVQLENGEYYKAGVDVEFLAKYKEENIEVINKKNNPKEHYTKITISKLHKKLSGKQIGKMKKQLAGMYRNDIRSGDIKIFYNDTVLKFEEPEVLFEESENITWKKDLKFNVEFDNKTFNISGFVALRQKGSTSEAGLALMKKGRVIIGGYEDTYRPTEIFGRSNSYEYQRIFGEINLDDFPVSQTKDGFDWYDGLEDAFIEKLKEVTEEYKKKAQELRKRPKIKIKPKLNEAIEEMEQSGVIDSLVMTDVPEEDNVEFGIDEEQNFIIPDNYVRNYTFNISGKKMYMSFSILADENPDNWLTIEENSDNNYSVKWGIKHTFFKRFNIDNKLYDFLEKFLLALALSEIDSKIISRDDMVETSTIRIKLNDILKMMAYHGGQENE
jgi:hypothetical protein